MMIQLLKTSSFDAFSYNESTFPKVPECYFPICEFFSKWISPFQIFETERQSSRKANWHKKCFTCFKCRQPLDPNLQKVKRNLYYGPQF